MPRRLDAHGNARSSTSLVTVMVMVLLMPSAGSAQLVRGQVVDSITGVPLGGSAIGLFAPTGDTVKTTLTDAQGLFLLRAPGPGHYQIRVDATGYRESVFPEFALDADGVRGFMLLVAPLAPPPPPLEGLDLARAVCPASIDDPIMLGLVYDEDGTPADRAVVTFSWETVPASLRGLLSPSEVNAGHATVTTDDSGFYAMCDLPSETPIAVHARRDDLQSEFVSLAFVGDSAVVGRDRHAAVNPRLWRQDLRVLAPGAWSATVSGRITDARSAEPLAGAQVRVASSGIQALSDSTGAFRLDAMPPGSPALALQRIGYHPMRYDVELTDGEHTRIPDGALALLRAATQLEPIVATAEAPGIARPLPGFDERRSRGLGSFITREEWEKQGSPQRPTDVLTRMQGLRVKPNPQYHNSGGPRWFVRTSRGSARSGFGTPGACPPIYYVDGHYVGDADQFDVDIALPFGDMVAVEAYGTIAGLPQQFNRPGAACGVVLFWTGR